MLFTAGYGPNRTQSRSKPRPLPRMERTDRGKGGMSGCDPNRSSRAGAVQTNPRTPPTPLAFHPSGDNRIQRGSSYFWHRPFGFQSGAKLDGGFELSWRMSTSPRRISVPMAVSSIGGPPGIITCWRRDRPLCRPVSQGMFRRSACTTPLVPNVGERRTSSPA